MATFLLIWNPERWPQGTLQKRSQDVSLGKLVTARWSCWKSHRIQKDDQIFFIRLDKEPKGIFAAGRVIQTASFITVQFEGLLHPETTAILSYDVLRQAPLSAMPWDSQLSGVQIPEEIASDLENFWMRLSSPPCFISPEEVSDSETEIYFEGTTQKIQVNSYERNAKAREKCISHYGTSCCVCQLDLGKIYPGVGEGFIHVHHLKPLSEIQKNYQVDPISDLRPICPNCHAMIHRRPIPYTIEEMQAIISSNLEHSSKP